MSTKKKRITKQIRVSEDTHGRLGKEAVKRKKTISKVADEVIYEGLRH